MLGLLTIFMVFATLYVAASPASPRVVNGTDAAEGEYPYIVSLRFSNSHSCGASILNEYYVVTAAHCVSGYSASYLSIQYGVVEISKDEINVIQVEKSVINENYTPGNGYCNDIAVLKLSSPIPLSAKAKPITLPKQDQSFEGWPTATLVGWGLPYSGGSVMTHLQKVNILVYPFEDCQKAHGSSVSEKCHVCAGIPEGGKGQCNGDSGGPLTVNGTLVGTVSWSVKPCTVAGYPGVYCKVSSFVEWIKQAIEELEMH